MKPQPQTTITIECSGVMVKLVAGPSTVYMTAIEAEDMVMALERAIHETRQLAPQQRVH